MEWFDKLVQYGDSVAKETDEKFLLISGTYKQVVTSYLSDLLNSVPPVANLMHPDFLFMDGVNEPRKKEYMMGKYEEEKEPTSGTLTLFQEGPIFAYKMVQGKTVKFGVVQVKEGMILTHEERS